MAKLRNLPAKTEFTFGGRQYILLEPATGYIVSKTSIITRAFDTETSGQVGTTFNTTRMSNLGAYLNGVYYNSLSNFERSLIQQHNWGNGLDTNENESERTVQAYICVLSRSEYLQYAGADYGFETNGTFWTRTQQWYSGTSWLWIGNQKQVIGTYRATETAVGVLAAMYIDPNANIENGKVIENTAPINTAIPNQSTQLGTNKTVNLSSYFSDADGDALTFTASSSNTAVGTVTISGSTLTLNPVSLGSTTITVTVNDGKGGTKSTTFAFSVVNSLPTVSVTAPSNNQTLYDNDTFSFSGSVNDIDLGNTVTIRYQINAATVLAIDAFLSTGVAKAFSKQLTFRGGSLYDGETLIASGLTDGVAHTLKIYATDDAGGQSEISTRTFYVVPNRAPALTINPITINGNIDSDKITVNGSYSDADNNATTVKYRINGGNSVQVASGTSGNFNFDLSFGQLINGLNMIVVEATDSYGAKTSKTIKLYKNVVSTELLKSTARYKILPPTGSVKAVLLWIQRNAGLAIKVSVSMTMAGEAESFKALTATNSAPLANNSSIIEDEFYREGTVAKDNIIVQIDMTRSSLTASDAITLISGVLE